LLVETSEGKSLYIANLATNQLDAFFFSEGLGYELFWSPDHKGLLVEGDTYITKQPTWVVNVVERKAAKIEGWVYLWSGFYKWTSDGRYAIYTSSDQYGNSDATVFDAWQWKTVISTTSKTCPFPQDMTGSCNRRVAEISPFTSTLLLKDGSFLSLSDFSETRVFSPGLVRVAEWSDNAKYLAIVHSLRHSDECHLYLVNANGTEPLSLATLSCYDYHYYKYRALQWEPNSKHAILFTKTARYVLDPVRQQVEILPADVSPTQTASQENNAGPCGNCDTFLNGESSLGEVTAACWSPDEALLAIGNVGNLSVYDANLNLLQTLAVSGTVKRLAWSLSDSD